MSRPPTVRPPMWRRYLRLLGPDLRGDVDDELRFHLDMRTQELVEAGLSPEAARAEALRHFGDRERVERELLAIGERGGRAARWAERLELVAGSVRHALRRVRRAPGFAAAVVLTFALGIGANAVMFGVVDRLLLRPPARVVDPGRVTQLATEEVNAATGARDTSGAFTWASYLELARARSIAAAAVAPAGLTLGRGPGAREVDARMVSGGYFAVLGPRAAVGRLLGPADDRVDAEGAAVISDDLWRRAYGGDAGVVGRTIDFGVGAYTIVGVAPRGFNGTDLRRVDLWLPLVPTRTRLDGGVRWMENRRWRFVQVVARLGDRPGAEAAPARVEGEATALLRRALADAGEERRGARSRVLALPLDPGRRGGLAGAARVATLLLGVAALVLLIACANVANLTLARALRDARETGMRLALGGSRARVVGQALTESLLLAAAGGLAALAMTRLGGEVVRAVLLPDVFWEASPAGGRVPALVLGLAVVAGVAAGLLPALQTSRPDVAAALRRGASRTHSGRGARTRSALTVLQATLSVALLIGAGLFVRSLHRVSSLDLGIDPAGVLLVNPAFKPGTPRARMEAFYLRAAERLRELPEVEAVSPDASPPFLGWMSVPLRVPGLDSIPRLAGGEPTIHVVDPDYFALLRLRVVRGRALDGRDVRGAPRAVVVSETMARALWPGQEPLGKCLVINDDPEVPGEPPCAEVVGVVENARQYRLVEGEWMSYYVAAAQQVVAGPPNGFLVRVRGRAADRVPGLQKALLGLDPALRYAHVWELRGLIDPQARSWRLGASMFSLFGVLSLLVSAVGLYGVLAFGVAQRRFELGVRAALGAGSGRLVGAVLAEALRLVGSGIALGTAVAVAAGGALAPLLFEVSPRDPLVYGGVALTLLLTGAAAAWIPSWRATRVDPATALRAE